MGVSPIADMLGVSPMEDSTEVEPDIAATDTDISVYKPYYEKTYVMKSDELQDLLSFVVMD